MTDLYFNHKLLLYTASFILPVFFCLAHYRIIGPHRAGSGHAPRTVLRLSRSERIWHWTRMITFIILALSGYAFACAMPSAQRAGLHGVIGGLFVLSSIAGLIIWFRASLFKKGDLVWLIKGGGYFGSKRQRLFAEKFNAGQKIFSWLSVILAFIFMWTGRSLFAGLHGSISPEAFRQAVAWHGYTAMVSIAFVLVHIYLGLLANPGTGRVLLDGKVSREWAAAHHPDWRF